MAVKPTSLNEIRKRAAAFTAVWRQEVGEEKQQAQSFVRDLLVVYGMTGHKAALYEKRAQRSSTGSRGFIDALVPGLCIIEMKSSGADLAVAEQQAMDYMDDLTEAECPRWVITSDFHHFRVRDIEAPKGQDVTAFALDDLPVRYQELAFLAGYQNRSFGSAEQEDASIKAARLMADLYESLEASGYDDHEASVFLVRTLFCLYADDAVVWGERDLFYEFLENRTSSDGSDLGPQLSMLFQALRKPTESRQKNIDELLARFPYVNGGIFAEQVSIPVFDAEMRAKLIEACSFNWSSISPAIFGSLFQAVKDKASRRELGEHYTTETNILKTIGPLFLDELRERFATHSHNVKQLKRLRKDLGQIRVFDPACGCGNFLVVAYRELRGLDLKILERLQKLGDRSEIPTLFFTTDDLSVDLGSVSGIELEEWPARIAETALQLVHHQANQAMELALGMAPEPLPLDKLDHIVVGNSLRLDWTELVEPSPDVRIVGNPPFVGQYTKQVDQTSDMKHVWEDGYDGYLDYVTAWFKKASDFFGKVSGGRFAFVSTNSIAQGQPVPALFRPLLESGWRLRFAHQTFAWTSEAPSAAAVHCVITGFDKREKSVPVLYSYDTVRSVPTAVPATRINAYLVDGPDVFVTKRSSPLSSILPATNYGSKPTDGGNLLISEDEYATVVADPVAAKYVRRYIGAKELLHDLPRWCLWLEGMDPADIKKSTLLRERVEAVKAMRTASRKAATRNLAMTPHLFAELRQLEVPYLGIPIHVSESRMYFPAARYGSDVICSNANFTAPDPDGFLFAVISSSMFLAWQSAVGGRIKSDHRFSNTLVWNNLPLPSINEKTRAEIVEAGKGVLEARALHPQRSLADHYNPLVMEPALLKAHRALDGVVDKAFGAKKPLASLQDRQAILFARYAELSRS